MFWLAQSPEILSDYLRQHFALFGLFFFIFFCLWAKKNTCIMSPPAILGQECRNTAMSNWWSWIHKLLRGNVSLWIRPCGSIYLSKLHYCNHLKRLYLHALIIPQWWFYLMEGVLNIVLIIFGSPETLPDDFFSVCFDFLCFNMWGVGELFHNTKLTVKLQW